jgi:sec-independent protein translocase protein TatB
VFGIGLPELAVIAIVAIFVFGPDRLPELARQAGRFVRLLKRFADGARDQLREELGPDYAALELRDLDPRAFIRAQIAEVLAEVEADGEQSVKSSDAPRHSP